MKKLPYLILTHLLIVRSALVAGPQDREECAALANEIGRAETCFDYETVATYTHPRSLKTFRWVVNQMVEARVSDFGESALRAALDLPDGLQELESLSDQAYFAHVMPCASLLLDERRKFETETLAVFERDGSVFVVCRRKFSLSCYPRTSFTSNVTEEFEKVDGIWRATGTQIPLVRIYLDFVCKGLRNAGSRRN